MGALGANPQPRCHGDENSRSNAGMPSCDPGITLYGDAARSMRSLLSASSTWYAI